MANKIRAVFTEGSTKFRTEPLWQYDYGQILEIIGLTLPESYEVHFSNDPSGSATTSIGDSSGVEIPDVYLQNGDVFAWLFLHTGENDGETVYQIEIPIMKRAAISNQPSTPVQQDAITQAINALNSAVSAIPGTIDTALAEAKASGEFDGKDGKDGVDGKDGKDGQDGAPGRDGVDGKDGADGAPGAPGADGKDGKDGKDGQDGQNGANGVTFTPSVSSAGVISWTNDGQQQNPESVDLVSAVIAALPSAVGVSF